MALSLEEFIHSLDLRTLPRVLEVQSGFYFEGKHLPISGEKVLIRYMLWGILVENFNRIYEFC